MDFESKTQLKTYNTEQQVLSNNGDIDHHILREKLELILQTLQEELECYKSIFQQQKDQLNETIKEKDDIIERLAQANSQLAIKNQYHQKNKIKDNLQYKSKFFQVKDQYQKDKNHLFSVIKYLETKNQEFSKKIKILEFNALKKNSRISGVATSGKYLIPDDSLLGPKVTNSTTLSLRNNILKESYVQHPDSPFYPPNKLPTSRPRLTKVTSAKQLTSLFNTQSDTNWDNRIFSRYQQKHDNAQTSPVKLSHENTCLNNTGDKRDKISRSSILNQYKKKNHFQRFSTQIGMLQEL